jgi:hypothetical protein
MLTMPRRIQRNPKIDPPFLLTVSTSDSAFDADALATALHDVWVSFDLVRTDERNAIIGGWFDVRRYRFGFELTVSHAAIVSISDPDEMSGFQVSDCQVVDRTLLIIGSGPPGTIELATSAQSTLQLRWEDTPTMVRTLRRWLPT